MKCMTCTGKQKITSNETSIYGLVKNIWICKLKNQASGNARCLVKSKLFMTTLNHLLHPKLVPQTIPAPSNTPSESADNYLFSLIKANHVKIVFFKEFLYLTNKHSKETGKK